MLLNVFLKLTITPTNTETAMLSSDPLDFYWLVILRDSVHLVPDYPGLPSQSDYATWNYRFSKPPLLLAVNVLNYYCMCYFSRRQRLSAQNRERRSTGVRRNLLFWLKLKCDVMFLKENWCKMLLYEILQFQRSEVGTRSGSSREYTNRWEDCSAVQTS